MAKKSAQCCEGLMDWLSTDLFRALSDPNRASILSRLAETAREMTVSDCDLDGSDFTASRIEQTWITDQSAKQARFDRANFVDFHLSDLDLEGASFRDAEWTDVMVSRCTLRHSDLSHATLRDVVVSGWWGRAPHARDVLVQILRGDAEDGVRERVVDVVASTRFTVMECDLISPPWDPTHCPPSVLWLVRMHGERMGEVRLYHPVPA